MPLRGVLGPDGAVVFQEHCGLLVREQELTSVEIQKMRLETRGGRGEE